MTEFVPACFWSSGNARKWLKAVKKSMISDYIISKLNRSSNYLFCGYISFQFLIFLLFRLVLNYLWLGKVFADLDEICIVSMKYCLMTKRIQSAMLKKGESAILFVIFVPYDGLGFMPWTQRTQSTQRPLICLVVLGEYFNM